MTFFGNIKFMIEITLTKKQILNLFIQFYIKIILTKTNSKFISK